jgi:hypothetical protein
MRLAVLSGLVSLSTGFPLGAQDSGTFNFTSGGGLSVPTNPAANFSGVGGSFLAGGGYNMDKHNAILGEFMWAGLPPSIGARAQLLGGSASVNVLSITADYKYSGNFSKTFGYYAIVGGGWFYRHSSVSKSTFNGTPTVCQPIWSWYGFTCSDGFVDTREVAFGTSSFGGNGGIGLTLKVKETGWKFFIESRYIYAPTRAIATTVVPVIFGLMYQ